MVVLCADCPFFSLTIFGTFLTRSGVLDSVHAFSGGAVGSIFLAVLAVLLVFPSAWRGCGATACVKQVLKEDPPRP